MCACVHVCIYLINYLIRYTCIYIFSCIIDIVCFTTCFVFLQVKCYVSVYSGCIMLVNDDDDDYDANVSRLNNYKMTFDAFSTTWTQEMI